MEGLNTTDYLRVKEVAERTGISEDHIRQLCQDGVLGATKPRGMRIWLIPPASLEELLNVRR
jgi:excisionase family DNA binding protein